MEYFCICVSVGATLEKAANTNFYLHGACTLRTALQVEPKLFFANERTFISWLHMAVIMSSMSIGVLAFSSDDSEFCFFFFLLHVKLAALTVLTATILLQCVLETTLLYLIYRDC